MSEGPDEHGPRNSEPVDDERGAATKKLVGRLLKKGIESGIGAISKSEDTLRGVVEGLKLPKEFATVAFEHIDDTKNGVYRAVAKEIRDFLQSTNFATEMKKVLTGLSFEVKMEVRLKDTTVPGGEPQPLRPEIDADVTIRERPRKGRRTER